MKRIALAACLTALCAFGINLAAQAQTIVVVSNLYDQYAVAETPGAYRLVQEQTLSDLRHLEREIDITIHAAVDTRKMHYGEASELWNQLTNIQTHRDDFLADGTFTYPEAQQLSDQLIELSYRTDLLAGSHPGPSLAVRTLTR